MQFKSTPRHHVCYFTPRTRNKARNGTKWQVIVNDTDHEKKEEQGQEWNEDTNIG